MIYHLALFCMVYIYSQSITKPFATYKIIQPISYIQNLLEYDSSQDTYSY